MKFSSNSIHAILLAGGVGSRLGSESPKQFLSLGGETLLHRSVRRFRDWGFLKSIILVSHPDTIVDAEKNLSSILTDQDRIVEGGLTRHDSTLKGMDALQEMGVGEGDYVFLHDVARPFFLYSELDDLLGSARVHGSSTLAVPCFDTLVRDQGGSQTIQESMPRQGIWQVKTPQIASWQVLSSMRKMDLDQIKDSGEKNASTYPTDLSTWCLIHGKPTGLVATSDWNMKVTRPGDPEIAELYLASLKLKYPDLE